MGLLRSGTLNIWCGMSVDTRMALGGGDTGSYRTDRRANALTSPKIICKLRATHCLTAPQSVISAAVVASQRHPGIHRHPTPYTQRPTPHKAHGSPNPRAIPIRDLAAVWAAPTLDWPLGAQVIGLTAHTCVLQRYIHESSSISYIEYGGSTSISV